MTNRRIAIGLIASLFLLACASVILVMVGIQGPVGQTIETLIRFLVILIFVFTAGWASSRFLLYVMALPGKMIHGRRLARWTNGQCVHCGYDLTANVSGICPECGRSAG
ncbi:MAG: hypothetical protein JWL69_5208 [Phycisphaerales bacterium]|jgi:type III secretory pathway component EscS|nr:hypothetical protein [Phycisphaerales bacterium]